MDEHLSVLTWERTALAYKGQQKFEEVSGISLKSFSEESVIILTKLKERLTRLGRCSLFQRTLAYKEEYAYGEQTLTRGEEALRALDQRRPSLPDPPIPAESSSHCSLKQVLSYFLKFFTFCSLCLQCPSIPFCLKS